MSQVFEDISENTTISFPIQNIGLSSETIKILRKNNIQKISYVFDIIEKLIKNPNKNEIAIMELIGKVCQYTPEKFEVYANEPDTDGNNLLLYLIGHSNINISLQIIQTGRINLLFLDKFGRNAFICAVVQKLNPVISALIEVTSIPFHIKDVSGYDALYYSIQTSHKELSERLLNMNIFDVSNIFPNNSTYLTCCIEKNIENIAMKIIDINPSTIFFYVDEIFYSVLHRVIVDEKTEIFMKIMEYKHLFTSEYINMEYHFNEGPIMTPLELTLIKSNNTFFVSILETGLVHIDVLNKIHSDLYLHRLYSAFDENSILKLFEYTSSMTQDMIQQHIFRAANGNKYNVVKYLLNRLENFLITDSNDNTLLLHCCKNRWFDLAEWILENTLSNVSLLNKKKESAFLWCCIYNETNLCKSILRKLPSSSILTNYSVDDHLRKCLPMVNKNKNEELKQLIEIKLIEIRLLNQNQFQFDFSNTNIISPETQQKIKDTESMIQDVMDRINTLIPSIEHNEKKPKIVCISDESDIQSILQTVVAENARPLDKIDSDSSNAVEIRVQKPSKRNYFFTISEVSTNIF